MNSLIKKKFTALFFLFWLCGCEQPKKANSTSNLPTQTKSKIKTKTLTHGSQQLLIGGWSQQQVKQHYGTPKKKVISDFKRPNYRAPRVLPKCDEQWFYPLNLGHRLIYFEKGKVVLAVEEWSDL